VSMFLVGTIFSVGDSDGLLIVKFKAYLLCDLPFFLGRYWSRDGCNSNQNPVNSVKIGINYDKLH
jgi:hypothetical protein